MAAIRLIIDAVHLAMTHDGVLMLAAAAMWSALLVGITTLIMWLMGRK